MNRRRFVYCAATGLMVPAVRASTLIPFSFWSSGCPLSSNAAFALNDWISRVQAASSDVTIAGTRAAVGCYIDGLMTDGVWTKLVRHSIFAGNDLNALKAPLKNGGPASADVLPNFVAGDYTQAVGLQGGSTKYVDTGLPWNSTAGSMSDTSFHASLYTRTLQTAGLATLQFGTAGAVYTALIIRTDANTYFYLNSAVDTIVTYSDPDGIGHYIGTRTASNAAALYKNGASVATGLVAIGARLTGTMFIGCLNNNGAPTAYSDAIFEQYSVGTGITAADATNLYNRYVTLRKALRR